MERNLPATQQDEQREPSPERPMEPPPRPVSVALIPLALVWFLILAFTIAAWTFIHSAF